MKHCMNKAAALLVAVLLLTVQLVPASTGCALTVKNSSGMNYSIPKNVLRRVTEYVLRDYEGEIYTSVPSAKPPYAAGGLNEAFLKHGLEYLNYIRLIAHLPLVNLSDELNESAQYGAVVLAANNKLTHYPSKPAGMSDTFYNNGCEATKKSNISGRWGYSNLNLTNSLSGCMDDDSSTNNLLLVGHRRWLLNPKLLNVGFGYACNTDENSTFTVTRVFDKSRTEELDYSYVAWPAAGFFPEQMISETAPWSVTLNPDEYLTPDAASVQIKVERESTGESWTLNSEDVTSNPVKDEEYLSVNTDAYGVSNCIIFSIGTDYSGTKLSGIYKITISGIKTKSGDDAVIEYITDFFDVYGDYRLGDVDDSGTVTAADARTILRAATKLETLEGKALKASILRSGTTEPSASDARTVLRVATGLETLPDTLEEPHTVEKAPGGYESTEQEFVDKVNLYRSVKGKEALANPLILQDVAQQRSDELKTLYDAQRPNGGSFTELLDAENISYTSTQQIVYQCNAEEPPSADELYSVFVSKTALNFYEEMEKDYTRIGVGMSKGDGKYFFTLILIK
ncbi:MAG: CAP domain-containing protein [Clostridiales bacterium]|nr:CAP domain-containing protein [Clostridiales bacterium]